MRKKQELIVAQKRVYGAIAKTDYLMTNLKKVRKFQKKLWKLEQQIAVAKN